MATSKNDAVTTTAALKSWLAHPTKATRARFERALERAQKSGKVAGVAMGKRRLEVRDTADGWTVVNAKTGDDVFFAKREKRARKVRSLNAETPRQFKARMSREMARDERKKAAAKKKQERQELKERVRATKKARKAKLKKVRTGCKAAVQAARKTKGPNARRVAVARARERCASVARTVEEGISKRVDRLERQFAELRQSRSAKPRRPTPARSSARERREERDQAVRDELERRGLADWVPIWDREKDSATFRSLPFDRAIEKFVESLENEMNAIAIQQQLEEAAGELLAGEAACGEAAEYAAAGDTQAALWAQEHCEDGRPRRKLSAVERTKSMFDGIKPPSGATSPRRGAKRKRTASPKRRSGPRARQQDFSVGRFGTGLIDTPGQQRTL